MAETAEEIEAEIRATWQTMPGPLPLGGVKISEQVLKLHNNPEGVRAPHILDGAKAAAGAGTFERYDLVGGGWVAVAIAPVDAGRHPYTLLMQLAQGGNTPPLITGAWRAYGVPNDASPTAAFASFMASAGLGIVVGSETGRFVAKNVLPVGTVQGIQVPDAPPNVDIYSMMYLYENGESEWTWCFAIDTARYQADVRNRR